MKTRIFSLIVITLLAVSAAISADKSAQKEKAQVADTTFFSAGKTQDIAVIDTTVVSVEKQAKLAELQREYRAVNEALNASYTIEQNELAKRLMLIEGKFEAYASIADTKLRLKK